LPGTLVNSYKYDKLGTVDFASTSGHGPEVESFKPTLIATPLNPSGPVDPVGLSDTQVHPSVLETKSKS